MISDALNEIVQQVESLPCLPDSAMRLIGVVDDPSSTIEQIVGTIRYDQAVTTELLRVCNSACYARTKRVASLDEAISYLGTARVLHIVLGAHTQSMLSKPHDGYGLPSGALWTHSVAVALGCQVIARRLRLDQIGPVFTAGLIHDIGKVLLNEHVAAEYAEIARRVSDDGVSFLQAERQVLGFTHAEVGGRVAARWELPEQTIRCIRYHHEPGDLDEPDPLVDAVHLSDVICLLMGVGGGDDGLLYRAHPAVMARHGMTEGDLEEIGSEIIFELKSVQDGLAAK